MNKGQTLISFLYPATNKEVVEELREAGVTSFAMDAVPRISRAQVSLRWLGKALTYRFVGGSSSRNLHPGLRRPLFYG